MESVSERPRADTWTGEVIPRDGRVPDLEALSRAVRQMGRQFWVRGVEATIDGRLVEESGRLALRVPDTGEIFWLSPLRRKVQWDRRLNREQPATAKERSSYERLAEGRQGRARLVRVVGPLTGSGRGKGAALEVRAFSWRD